MSPFPVLGLDGFQANTGFPLVKYGEQYLLAHLIWALT